MRHREQHKAILHLERQIAERMGRRYARLVGRGTTALYIALRAIQARDGNGESGEIILPDMICSTVLDAVLLAGFDPVFADVTPHRFTLDAVSVKNKITPRTRGIITAHVFGHVCDPLHFDFGIPIIEDAVQGLGASKVGQLGEISFLSFHETKMIGGRGGAILTDDPALWEIIQGIDLVPPVREYSGRFAAYLRQIQPIVPSLLCEFDPSPANIAQIESGWATLTDEVASRNRKAEYLHQGLSDLTLPLHLPEIRVHDAIWRYSFAAPNRATANWILRHLQIAGLSGSSLYPPLGDLFALEPLQYDLFSASLAHRMVNLWVDSSTSEADLDKALAIIRAAPYSPSVSTPR